MISLCICLFDTTGLMMSLYPGGFPPVVCKGVPSPGYQSNGMAVRDEDPETLTYSDNGSDVDGNDDSDSGPTPRRSSAGSPVGQPSTRLFGIFERACQSTRGAIVHNSTFWVGPTAVRGLPVAVGRLVISWPRTAHQETEGLPASDTIAAIGKVRDGAV